MDMVKRKKPIIGNIRRRVIEKNYDWGLYVYKKADGKWFTDGEENVLNIPAKRGDIEKIAELKKAAMYYGDDGSGSCIFVPGLNRVSEEQYSEMKDRMKQGLIPNLNDLGAVYDAQQTLKKHGREAYESE
jgi:hypothetical protein